MNYLILIFATVTQTYNLPSGLISSICYVESKHDPAAISYHDGNGDSIGLCQIKLKTAELVGYKGDVSTLHHSPAVNAHYAGKYLRHLLDRYHNDPVKAIAAYNAGSYRVSKDGLPKNRKYVKKVMNVWEKKNCPFPKLT